MEVEEASDDSSYCSYEDEEELDIEAIIGESKIKEGLSNLRVPVFKTLLDFTELCADKFAYETHMTLTEDQLGLTRLSEAQPLCVNAASNDQVFLHPQPNFSGDRPAADDLIAKFYADMVGDEAELLTFIQRYFDHTPMSEANQLEVNAKRSASPELIFFFESAGWLTFEQKSQINLLVRHSHSQFHPQFVKDVYASYNSRWSNVFTVEVILRSILKSNSYTHQLFAIKLGIPMLAKVLQYCNDFIGSSRSTRFFCIDLIVGADSQRNLVYRVASLVFILLSRINMNVILLKQMRDHALLSEITEFKKLMPYSSCLEYKKMQTTLKEAYKKLAEFAKKSTV